jgi:hypothetical protein
MTVTALIGVNLFILRSLDSCWNAHDPSETLPVTGSLAMANVLAIGTGALLRNRWRGRSSAFLLGFVLAGWVSSLFFLYCYVEHQKTRASRPKQYISFGYLIDAPMESVLNRVFSALESTGEDSSAVRVLVLGVALSTPQWLLPLMGGLACRTAVMAAGRWRNKGVEQGEQSGEQRDIPREKQGEHP